MKVKAVNLGFYGNKRRKPDQPGSVFQLKEVKDFSPNWMKILSATDAEKNELKTHLVERKKLLDSTEPKRIKIVDDGFDTKGTAIDANNKDQFDSLFTSGDKEVDEEKRREAQGRALKERTEKEGTDHPADFSGTPPARDASYSPEDKAPVAPKAVKGKTVQAKDEDEAL